MANPPEKRIRRKEAAEVETEPDAWERFERAADKVVPPKRPKPKDEKAPDK